MSTNKDIYISKSDMKLYKNLNSIKHYNFDKRYIVDINGNVYLTKTIHSYNKIKLIPIKSYTDRNGYIEYVLTDKYGKKKHILMHRMIAELYIPKKINKKYVNHINGNRKDNRLENLEWVNQSENIKKMWNMKNKKKTI